MAEDTADEPAPDVSSDVSQDRQWSAVSSNYKGLGYNTTGNGTTYGVLGQVDSSDGYGL